MPGACSTLAAARDRGHAVLNGQRAVRDCVPRLPAGIEFHERPSGLLRPQQRLRMSGTARSARGGAGGRAQGRGGAQLGARPDPAARAEETGTGHRGGRDDRHGGFAADRPDAPELGHRRSLRRRGGRDSIAPSGWWAPRSSSAEGGDLRFAEGDVLLVMGLADEHAGLSRAADSLLEPRGDAGAAAPLQGGARRGAIMGGFGRDAGLDRASCRSRSRRWAGAILMFVTGCVKFDRVGRGALRPSVIVLVAASIALGTDQSTRAVRPTLARRQVHGRRGCDYLSPGAALAAIMLAVTVPDQFRVERHRGDGGHADRLRHRQRSSALPPEPLGAGGAVRLQPVLRHARSPIRPTC